MPSNCTLHRAFGGGGEGGGGGLGSGGGGGGGLLGGGGGDAANTPSTHPCQYNQIMVGVLCYSVAGNNVDILAVMAAAAGLEEAAVEARAEAAAAGEAEEEEEDALWPTPARG